MGRDFLLDDNRIIKRSFLVEDNTDEHTEIFLQNTISLVYPEDFLGIEIELKYWKIAQRRLSSI